MTGDKLDVYWGELFFVPAPLEVSFNWCNFSCLYCFANLNKPDRTADIGATMRLLADFQNRQTYAAKLLQAKYPVLISNRVDPFAPSNYKQALPVLETLTALDIPVFVQTKGGPHAYTGAKLIKPSVWYISIAMLKEELRKQIEPGAPSIASRFDLIEHLLANGHGVYVGINPVVSEWLADDYQSLLNTLKALGVKIAMSQPLHFNEKQAANLSPKERIAIGEELIARSSVRKRKADDHPDIVFQKVVGDYAESIGVENYSFHRGGYSQLPDLFARYYPVRFPLQHDFQNHLIASNINTVYFDDYADFFESRFPSGVLEVGHYLGSTAHNLWSKYKFSNWMTFRELLEIFWREPQTHDHLPGLPAFSYAVVKDGKEYIPVLDEADRPVLVFDPDGFDELYVEIIPNGGDSNV